MISKPVDGSLPHNPPPCLITEHYHYHFSFCQKVLFDAMHPTVENKRIHNEAGMAYSKLQDHNCSFIKSFLFGARTHTLPHKGATVAGVIFHYGSNKSTCVFGESGTFETQLNCPEVDTTE